MAQHGGYRKPGKPAAVSGPGALSARTDGGPTQMQLSNAKYGEQADFQSVQGGAPLSPSPSQTPQATTPAGGATPSLTPLHAPTERPDEPVTAGAPVGAGVGPEALGLPDQNKLDPADRSRLASYLPVFIERANDPNATQAFKNWVRALRAELDL